MGGDGETGGGGICGGGGEGVAKPQRSSRASSARRRPLLSLGMRLPVASVSLLDVAERPRGSGGSRAPLLLSVTRYITLDCYIHTRSSVYRSFTETYKN